MITSPENKRIMDEFFATNQFDKTGDWKASAEADADPDDEEGEDDGH